MIRSGSAVWKGNLREGSGTVSTESGVLRESPYSFRSRFESEPATNPEELIAGAHAACFSMALSLQLQTAGHTAERIETTAKVTLEKLEAGFTITASHLTLVAKVPGIKPEEFSKLAEGAKSGCVVSRALNAAITMESKLLS
ncbi:MAG TPA: OsmC family protein [Candidatus Eisenbacteria bacterium]|nr:OsmC family protein [Candidatus Eisenbacteria bacterium]